MIAVGDILDISYKQGKIQVEKIDENWDKVVNNIDVKYMSSKTAKRAGELYAKNLSENKRLMKRILPDFIIGAHAEQYSGTLVIWNPSDYDINKEVMTPAEIMGVNEKA